MNLEVKCLCKEKLENGLKECWDCGALSDYDICAKCENKIGTEE